MDSWIDQSAKLLRDPALRFVTLGLDLIIVHLIPLLQREEVAIIHYQWHQKGSNKLIIHRGKICLVSVSYTNIYVTDVTTCVTDTFTDFGEFISTYGTEQLRYDPITKCLTTTASEGRLTMDNIVYRYNGIYLWKGAQLVNLTTAHCVTNLLYSTEEPLEVYDDHKCVVYDKQTLVVAYENSGNIVNHLELPRLPKFISAFRDHYVLLGHIDKISGGYQLTWSVVSLNRPNLQTLRVVLLPSLDVFLGCTVDQHGLVHLVDNQYAKVNPYAHIK